MSATPNPNRANRLKWISGRRRASSRNRRELKLTPWMQLLETRQLMSIYVVTNTTDSGAGSLRQAILDANGGAGADTINFDIGGGGPATISPLSVLPDITDTVTIDATNQPGWSGTPLIQIDGTLAGAVGGLTFSVGSSVDSSGSLVQGLIISNFSGAAGITLNSDSDVVQGDWIGTDATGSAEAPDAMGISITGSDETVGGTTAAQRNVIAGSTYGVYLDGSSNSSVLGNYIGTNAAGTSALPGGFGVYLFDSANSNVIGGATAAAANVISGNTNAGVTVDGAGTINNALLNNLVGVTADQSSDLPNSGGALVISNGAVVQAGGTFTGDVADAGTLDLHGNNVSIVGGLTGSGIVNNNATSGAATLTLNGTGTFSGSIADGGAATTALTIAGGAETLTGSNGFSGPTAITAGTLQVGNGGTTGTLGAGTVTDNGTLAYDYSNSINFTKVIGGSGTLSLTSNGGAITQGVAITVGGVVANAATGVTLNGPGNTFSSFSATNSTSGAISLTDTSTSLVVSGITQSGTTAGSNVTVNQTGALVISGAVSTTAAANGVISLTSSGPLTANAGS